MQLTPQNIKEQSSDGKKYILLFPNEEPRVELYVAKSEYVHENLSAFHDHDNARDYENAYVHDCVNVHALNKFEHTNLKIKRSD